jgi:hypothetical protein
VEFKMTMADSIVYATARALDGLVWMRDSAPPRRRAFP